MARSFPSGDIRDMILTQTMDSLIRQDPARAFAMADSLGAAASTSLQSFMGANIKDPGQARRMLEAAPHAGNSSFRKEAAKSALLVWMQSDPASLGAWLNGRTSPSSLHLLAMAAYCKPVMATVLRLTGHEHVAIEIDLQAFEAGLEQTLAVLRRLSSRGQ